MRSKQVRLCGSEVAGRGAQVEECEKAGCLGGGVLTPATAMGPVLLRRLAECGGVSFSVSSAVGARDTLAPERPVFAAADGAQPSKM